MEQHICKNCSNKFEGKYCNNCGEKAYNEKDKNVWHLLEEAFHFTTHFEGTFFNTFKAILLSPGKLSMDYCNGVRKKYFKPISFFFLLVILYLLFPVFEGLNQKLYHHTHNDLYGNYAIRKCTMVMQTQHLSQEKLAELFHEKGEKVSKFLLFIIIPLMALFSWLPGFKKRKLYFDHFIFSIEEGSFLILWGFLLLPLLDVLARTLGLSFLFSSDYLILATIGFILLLHIFFAAKKFFNFTWSYAIFYALLYTFLLGCVIQYLYKFLLFFITIHQI